MRKTWPRRSRETRPMVMARERTCERHDVTVSRAVRSRRTGLSRGRAGGSKRAGSRAAPRRRAARSGRPRIAALGTGRAHGGGMPSAADVRDRFIAIALVAVLVLVAVLFGACGYDADASERTVAADTTAIATGSDPALAPFGVAYLKEQREARADLVVGYDGAGVELTRATMEVTGPAAVAVDATGLGRDVSIDASWTI